MTEEIKKEKKIEPKYSGTEILCPSCGKLVKEIETLSFMEFNCTRDCGFYKVFRNHNVDNIRRKEFLASLEKIEAKKIKSSAKIKTK